MIEANDRRSARGYFWFALLLLIILAASAAHAATVTLLNVSYDPTRELYQAYNDAFARYWKAKPATMSSFHNPMAARASRRSP